MAKIKEQIMKMQAWRRVTGNTYSLMVGVQTLMATVWKLVKKLKIVYIVQVYKFGAKFQNKLLLN